MDEKIVKKNRFAFRLNKKWLFTIIPLVILINVLGYVDGLLISYFMFLLFAVFTVVLVGRMHV